MQMSQTCGHSTRCRMRGRHLKKEVTSVKHKPAGGIAMPGGLAATRLTNCDVSRNRIPERSVVFITTGTTIYSLGHGRCTHATSSSMSTRPSTLNGTVKRTSVVGDSNNNKWRWCGRQRLGARTARVGWFGSNVRGHRQMNWRTFTTSEFYEITRTAYV